MFLFQNWIIIAVLAGLASNAFNFFNRYILKDKDDPTMYAWYQEALKLFIFGSIAIFDWKLIVNQKSIVIFILLGLSEFISVYMYMKMHSYTHLSISSLLSRTRLIWIAIFAFILIGEKLKISEYIGIVVLFFGISIAIAPKKLVADRGARYAASAAVIIALNVVILKLALPYASNSVVNAIVSLPSIFLFPLFMKNARTKIPLMLRTNLRLKSLAIGINAIGLLLFTLALRTSDTSKVSAIYNGMLIFSVLAGIIFLKKRENIGRKLVGATVTIVGVILLTSF